MNAALKVLFGRKGNRKGRWPVKEKKGDGLQTRGCETPPPEFLPKKKERRGKKGGRGQTEEGKYPQLTEEVSRIQERRGAKQNFFNGFAVTGESEGNKSAGPKTHY